MNCKNPMFTQKHIEICDKTERRRRSAKGKNCEKRTQCSALLHIV